MRCLRSCLWLSVFVLGAALPAFCQIIVPPNGSGFRIPETSTKLPFRQDVYSTGPYDFFLMVLHNGRAFYAAGATVCTTGPTSRVSVPLSLAGLGLQSGDALSFLFWVRHRTTEGGTTSFVMSVIPVGSDAGTTEPPPPTTTSSKLLPVDAPPWARREEGLFG